jgi:hypothetical protein
MSRSKFPPLLDGASHAARVVHQHMLKHGIDHREASIKAGLAEGYARDLFRGRSKRPGQETLFALARAISLDIAALACGPAQQGAAPRDKVGDELPYTASEISIVSLWRLLSDEGRDIVLGQMGKLIERHPRRDGGK